MPKKSDVTVAFHNPNFDMENITEENMIIEEAEFKTYDDDDDNWFFADEDPNVIDITVGH